MIPGLQIDGYFSDRSTTKCYNNEDGFPCHDSQFVIRLPEDWNGKLVVTGAPGVRKRYALDFIISDFVLSKGYAFASTDKGNTGQGFWDDGFKPGGSVAEWHRRVEQLAKAATTTVERRYGKKPDFTYMTSISNGGYLTRYAIENNPELYDGAVDWEGVLWRRNGPNLFTHLPQALRHWNECKSPRRPPGTTIMPASSCAGGLPERLGISLGGALRNLLGPHQAHLLPGGVRSGLRRRHQGRRRDTRDAKLPGGGHPAPEIRRELPVQEAARAGQGSRG